jgi:leader peptidase (prepilin peptidase) / N-methyltransferase
LVAAIGLLGAVIGSFLNVVVHRLPRGESIVKPRSRCPGCGMQLAAWDNVPVVSWLVLRARCRGCGEPISARYPLVELVTALTFVVVALARGFDADLLLELPFAAMLIAVAAIDLEHRIVPNRILLPLAVWALAGSALVRPDMLPELAIAGAAAFTALLLAALAYPAGMGMGDVKLAGVMGLYLGAAVAPAMLVAFLSGSLAGIAIMLREGGAARKKALAFAPFLALGGLVGLLAGPELIDLYTERFL